MSGHRRHPDAFAPSYLADVRLQVRKNRYFTTNNLNRDFVGTRGFSVVFHRSSLERVRLEFPWAAPYLDRALRPDCNAFYFNPLQLQKGSHVAPHIDRSLRSYVLDIHPPLQVSVLYVDVPAGMRGGELVLRRNKKLLGRVAPEAGLLVEFDGDLEHSVERVDTDGLRLSLVCEQYALEADELEQVPEYRIESRARAY
ncbi:MAG: 2OG-Fe(II) oxygenase [Planctomycetes bacterium]|nr:2OG-Fe(II) oxygenase [Planctomycetota bacterium]